MEYKGTQKTILKALEWGYIQAINGLPGTETAEEFAASYMKGRRPVREKVDSLIRWQITKAATSGFVTGLPGLLMMPVTLPANLTSCWYIQLRMIAAIAHMGGHDVRDDKVQTLAFACLCGNGAKEIFKDVGIVVGRRFTFRAVESMSGRFLTKINQAVGFRLLTKFGQTGAVNFGKMVPLVGATVGATIDGVATNIIGNVARDAFLEE